MTAGQLNETNKTTPLKRWSLYAMAVLYTAAGVNHFINPKVYVSIMPPWLHWHHQLVIISGIVEVGLGVLLLLPATRRFAAVGIIVLLIAVFPANVQMMLNYTREQHPAAWIAILRLPLQALLIWWAYTHVRLRK
ncbi:DoxX family protein [Segetibacter sp. 3557_3]|uniref:DoxX family protein n=1 Tax=Segetibacter sp. 3557_3 TaxID=2547429 RepID=UPI00105909EE|nr:DoxX family protein [Segetibacter sp. 3557_3]TDH27500.1 DoxX family protein [Segetibacter sp. 3557_3]